MNWAYFPMMLIKHCHLGLRDAWNMSMSDYNLIMTLDKQKPMEIVYDKETQDRIIGRSEVRDLIRG